MAILEVQNVNKSFGGLKALHEVNLAVEENTIHAIIGPNGAGKTTTMRMIMGLSTVSDGSLHVFNEPAGELGRDTQARIAELHGNSLKEDPI